MSLYLRSTVATTASVTLAGAAIYTVYKTGALRPVAVGVIRGGIKATDWFGKKFDSVRNEVKKMIIDARSEALPAKEDQ